MKKKVSIEEVVITKTELRGLIFWATRGIERANGGSYDSTVKFINNNYDLMRNDKERYKKLSFGTRIENCL